MEFLLLSAATIIVIGAIVWFIFSLAHRYSVRSDCEDRAHADRSIAPNQLLFGGFFVMSCTMAAVSVWVGFFYRENVITGETTEALLMTASGLFVTWMISPFLSKRQRVTWDDTGVEGPLSLRPFPFRRGRGRIDYADIDSAGTNWVGTFSLRGPGKKVLRFDFTYPGFNALIKKIRTERPDLFKGQ
jgi:hypothetical protein